METKVLEMQYEGKCPHCGKDMGLYVRGKDDYGSPVRTCKKCNGKFLDRRYHEIEIEGYRLNTLSVWRDIKIVLFGVIFFEVTLYMNLWTIEKRNYYSLNNVYIQIIAIIMILYALIDIIMIKTGIKEKRLEKKRMESVARLQNPEYAKTLAEFGYPVPDKYL